MLKKRIRDKQAALQISPLVHQRAKVHCARKGIKIKEFIETLITQALVKERIV